MNTIKAFKFFSPIEVEPRYESVNGVPHLKIINIVLASHLREIFDQTSMPAIVLIVHQPHKDSSEIRLILDVSTYLGIALNYVSTIISSNIISTDRESGHRRVSPSSKQRGEPCSVAADNDFLLIIIMLTC